MICQTVHGRLRKANQFAEIGTEAYPVQNHASKDISMCAALQLAMGERAERRTTTTMVMVRYHQWQVSKAFAKIMIKTNLSARQHQAQRESAVAGRAKQWPEAGQSAAVKRMMIGMGTGREKEDEDLYRRNKYYPSCSI